ncbi:hypothetical protein GALMADRAFT_1352495 [Galerina marginata CBS 339.88]|uniref:Uncharacterized protein n=1 Tax=Galerina marginata (strain CBS 339.88) TaxID=685588 RepID=A0A067SF26_GALM3|nr:hypothetical protein GALMADRAFT_1352495 [Galerina marginata CBS 339.88]
MSASFYRYGEGVIVATRGPGSVHLISYESNTLPAHIGKITTSSPGVTRFLISHSYTFTKFAFYWDGNGEAVCGKGQELGRQAVGKSWETATCADWGTSEFVTKDVTAFTASALPRDNGVTCFIIPDKF